LPTGLGTDVKTIKKTHRPNISRHRNIKDKSMDWLCEKAILA